MAVMSVSGRTFTPPQRTVRAKLTSSRFLYPVAAMGGLLTLTTAALDFAGLGQNSAPNIIARTLLIVFALLLFASTSCTMNLRVVGLLLRRARTLYFICAAVLNESLYVIMRWGQPDSEIVTEIFLAVVGTGLFASVPLLDAFPPTHQNLLRAVTIVALLIKFIDLVSCALSPAECHRQYHDYDWQITAACNSTASDDNALNKTSGARMRAFVCACLHVSCMHACMHPRPCMRGWMGGWVGACVCAYVHVCVHAYLAMRICVHVLCLQICLRSCVPASVYICDRACACAACVHVRAYGRRSDSHRFHPYNHGSQAQLLVAVYHACLTAPVQKLQ